MLKSRLTDANLTWCHIPHKVSVKNDRPSTLHAHVGVAVKDVVNHYFKPCKVSVDHFKNFP